MELRRLEQLSFSPILTNLSESYNGLHLLRSQNQFKFLNQKFNDNVNALNSVMYHDRMCSAFVNLITELLVGFLIMFVLLFFFLAKVYNWTFLVTDPSLASVSINWVLVLPLSINFFMFTFAECQKGMSSIQRIFLNIQEGTEEGPFDEPIPPQEWPRSGTIDVENIDIKYRENTPLVLKDVTFHIKHAEKIGVVGRTGSGKSTLLNALARILEVCNEGKIYIDDIDIKDIGLTFLRSKIQVIPQEPYLIEGTIRENVDPMNQLEDKEIIEALRQAFLWDSVLFVTQEDNTQKDENGANVVKVVTDQDKLNFKIVGKGDNISNGQRQLLCIARALCSSPKILFMDEATSNIDPETDKKI